MTYSDIITVRDRGQRALDLLAELVRLYDYGFPPSAEFRADPMTTLLIIDLSGLVRRAREELAG